MARIARVFYGAGTPTNATILTSGYVADDGDSYHDEVTGASWLLKHGTWTKVTTGGSTSSPTTTRGDLIRRGASADERVALGTSAQVLGSDDTDAVWVAKTPLTTRGDLIRAAAAGVPERVGLGSAGQALISDGTDAVWGVGSPFLAVHSYRPGSDDNTYAITGTSFADIDAANLVVTFTTPASGNVLIKFTGAAGASGSINAWYNLREAAADVANTGQLIGLTAGANQVTDATWYITGLTPGAAHTYKIGCKVGSGTLNLEGGPTYGSFVITVSPA